MGKKVDKKYEPKGWSSVKTRLGEFQVECSKNETNNRECMEDGSRIVIMRPKRTQDRNSKPIKVVLERPSERISQHLKLLYIKAHFDGLPIYRVLIDGGSAINFMHQIML